MVRDRLWEKVVKKKRSGGCLLVYPANNEQGFLVRSTGKTDRTIVDYEGLTLVLRPKTS